MEPNRQKVLERAKTLFLPYDPKNKDSTGRILWVQLFNGKLTLRCMIYNPRDDTKYEMSFISGNQLEDPNRCRCIHFKKWYFCKHTEALEWWLGNYRWEWVPHESGKYAVINFIRKSQGVANINWRKTHCPYGHPYSGDNLIVGKDNKRRCKTCIMEKRAERINKSNVPMGTPTPRKAPPGTR